MKESDRGVEENTETPSTVSIIFTPSGKRGNVEYGISILDAARQLNVDLDSVCGGRAMCGRCQVQPTFGKFAKHQIISLQKNLSPPSKAELRYDEKKSLRVGRRLGCNTRILGDTLVDIPEDSQVHRQVIRKKPEPHDIKLAPHVELFFVKVNEPNMHDPLGDFERLCQSLRERYSSSFQKGHSFTCSLPTLRDLQKVLRESLWQITVAVYDGKQIKGVWPGQKETIFGLAVDVGSTTLSAQLCNLKTGKVIASAGTMNPQIRFGEDLMSRVSYLMMNPDDMTDMTREVRTAINYLAAQTTNEVGSDPSNIVDVVLVGNPIMHHILLGIDPTELGGAPFALATDMALNITAEELDLYFNPSATAYILPCIAGHVGADTAAVILAHNPLSTKEMTLIIDIGTNAEIVLGNCDRVLACSCPTGPAFEGAQISCGQRAAPGAIERVRVDRDTLEPSYQIIGCELWSTEESFNEETRHLGITGICGSGIIEVIAELYLAGVISTDGVIDGTLTEKNDKIFLDGRTYSYKLTDTISITQNDIRAIQLAKAALHASFQLLLDKTGTTIIDKVILVGAFGNYIDTKYAMVLGMIPDCDLQRVHSAGNAAGTGARIALLDKHSRKEIETIVKQIEKIETAVEPMFQDYFVDAMAIPHKKAPYDKLRKFVEFPNHEQSNFANATERKRRRGRQR